MKSEEDGKGLKAGAVIMLVLHSPRALQRHVATALNSSLDAIGLALAPRPAEAEPEAVTAATG